MVQPVLWKLNLKANGISGGFNLLLMGQKQKTIVLCTSVIFVWFFYYLSSSFGAVGCLKHVFCESIVVSGDHTDHMLCLSCLLELTFCTCEPLFSMECLLPAWLYVCCQFDGTVVMKDNKRRLWLLHVYRRGGPGFRGCFVHQVEKFLSRIVYVPVCDCT